MSVCRKRCYRTRAFAKQKLRAFRGKGLTGARGPVHVYFCEHHAPDGAFHIGHHGKRSNAEMRADLRAEMRAKAKAEKEQQQ